MAIREVTEADGMARDVAALLDAIRENTDATKRLVDELVRERSDRARAQGAGRKRATTIRASAPIVGPLPAEAHAAASRLVARLGRAR